MISRRIIIGGYYEIPGVWKDANGDAIDMTGSNRVGKLRLWKVGAAALALDLSTENAADWTWSVQASGTGYWLLTAARTEALTAGRYNVDARYEDGATTKPHLVGETHYEVRDSETGLV